MAEESGTTKILKITQILEVVFLLMQKMATVIDKLRKGEIDPESVQVKEWIAKLEALEDLPEA